MAVALAPPENLLPVPGVRLSACSAQLYKDERLDMALIEFGNSGRCSAVFTQNSFCAAPIMISREHIRHEAISYCVINAGNANAGTGDRGYQDALNVCQRLAEISGSEITSILPFSTGIIGEDLPVNKLLQAVPVLYLGLNENNWLDASRAIMTTDTIPKAVSRVLNLGGESVTITGMAKGSGMIRPDMATMLAFIATDATLEQNILDEILSEAVLKSFNRITIDGDTSTNDACVLIASGENRAVLNNNNLEILKTAIIDICIELAQAIVKDGEGASKFITINVCQGRTAQECLDVSYVIAHSPLVKTAMFASDPNWGRILSAIGRAGIVELDISKVSITINGVRFVENGMRSDIYSEEKGQLAMSEDDIILEITLDRGDVSETVWTCDLSYDYVKINAEYRT